MKKRSRIIVFFQRRRQCEVVDANHFLRQRRYVSKPRVARLCELPWVERHITSPRSSLMRSRLIGFASTTSGGKFWWPISQGTRKASRTLGFEKNAFSVLNEYLGLLFTFLHPVTESVKTLSRFVRIPRFPAAAE